jgi:hypothetical protein
MKPRTQRLIRLGIMLAAGGTCLQITSCFGGIARVFNTVNPCGNLLNCDPREFQFVTSGIDGPGVRADVDPFCTFAPFCDEGSDPIFGGLVDQP